MTATATQTQVRQCIHEDRQRCRRPQAPDNSFGLCRQHAREHEDFLIEFYGSLTEARKYVFIWPHGEQGQ